VFSKKNSTMTLPDRNIFISNWNHLTNAAVDETNVDLNSAAVIPEKFILQNNATIILIVQTLLI
jgi:hypothetical protein